MQWLEDFSGLVDFLERYLDQHPSARARDLYKLLYQGICGPEHIISSPEAFIHNLIKEYEAIEPLASILLTEPIRPDGLLHRIHLKAHKARKLSITRLADLCLETSRQTWGSVKEVAFVWQEITRLHQQGRLSGIPTEEMQSFSAWVSDMNFPAVHHSREYSNSEQPSYRLISANLIPHLFDTAQ